MEAKSKIISELLKKGIVANREVVTGLKEITDMDHFYNYFSKRKTELDEQTGSFLKIIEDYNRLIQETGKIKEETEIKKDTTDEEEREAGTVEVLFSYEEVPKKREVKDFVSYFNARYKSLRKILMNRKELTNLNSISRIQQRREKGDVALIGIISDKRIFRSGTIMLQVEDPTGTIKVMIKDRNPEAYETAKESSMDEVIGVVGMNMGEIIYANSIIMPDIPLFKELKKSPDNVNALFLGDFHFGSNVFIQEALEKFIKWLRAEQGNEKQKEAAKKVKYIFILGDLVEGVGIYPNQEDDLVIKDIYEQYKEFAKQLSRIPKHIKIIICPGNHDAMRIAEPQPALYKDFAEAVWEMPNVVMVSNPSYVNIHKTEKFPGFDVLLYHGYSFIYYSDTVESIRSKGGMKRPDLIMKYLLKRRHLAPTHTSTLYLPQADFDPLVIDKIPDIFASGHIHRVSAANYRNITLLNCSCWLKTTENQEKVGLTPQAGRAVLVNLKSRKVKILKFYDDLNEDPLEIEDISDK